MAKAQLNQAGKQRKVKGIPQPSTRKKDPGVPKLSFGQRNKNEIVLGATAVDLRETSVQDTFEQRVASSSATPIHVDNSAKAYMREFRKVLDLADVVIQVLDARDPLGCRSRLVENEVRQRSAEGKRLVLVMNKIDLVPRENVEAWLKYLRHDYPTFAFKSSTQEQRSNLGQRRGSSVSKGGFSSECLGAEPLVQLLKNYARSFNLKTSVTVGIVGHPNVGKSSLINSLKRTRACGVAATPGHTKVAQEVVLDKNVKLLDCPGIVFADASDATDGSGETRTSRTQAEILLRNVVKVEMVEDPVMPVEVILSRCDSAYMQRLYTIPPYADVNEFLIMVALSRGRLGKGGKPDLDAAARSVLRDWNSGKITYHTNPPAVHPSSLPSADAPQASGASTTTATDVGQASIVQQWGEAFDLAGLFGEADNEVWEGMDMDPLPEVPGEERAPERITLPSASVTVSTTSRKRARSPSNMSLDDVSERSVPSIGLRGRILKRPRVKFAMDADPSESATLASANPLNRARLRKDAKKLRKLEGKSSAHGLADEFATLGVAAS